MKKKIEVLFWCLFVALICQHCNLQENKVGLQISTVKTPSTATFNKHYLSNKQPLRPTPLLKLPIGSIQPEGWLSESLLRAKNGMTGRLGVVSEWLEKKDNAWLSPIGEGIHGWEEVPYWLKGFGDLAYILGDSAMIAEAKIWIDGALNSQRADGYFGPESSRHDGKPDLWPNMVMLWCLQSYYDYSADERVLPFMTRYFEWENSLPDSSFLEDYWGNSRGGDNLYSVYWLYNHTGDEWLLDLTEKIHRNTADWEQAGNLPNWHNVNIAQGFREPAVYFMQTSDSSDIQAAYDNYYLIRKLYGQVPGGMFGADENAREGFTGPQQGIETCGMVEQMNSDQMMLRISGDPLWADNAEDVAFNTYPAALTPDFKALRYFTAPNMVTSDSSNHHPGIDNTGPFFMMNPLSNRCCQHNHTQGWPYYAENLWMATPDNGLAAVLFASGKVTAQVGEGSEVTIQEDSHYPFSDSIQFSLHFESSPARFPLYLRIPGWCDQASVTINGEEQNMDLLAGQYVRIESDWENEDQIILHLPREVRMKKWTENQNSVSVTYGPLAFSLKIDEDIHKADPQETALHDSKWRQDVDIKQWPAYSILPASHWNYGLLLQDDTESPFEVEQKDWPEDNYPFTTDAVPLALRAKGKRIPEWTLDENGLCGPLPDSPVEVNTKAESLTLIPMGAARLRISAFPVVR